MKGQIDYGQVSKLIDCMLTIPDETIIELKENLSLSYTKDAINISNETLHHPKLISLLISKSLCHGFFVESEEHIPVDLYAFLYATALRGSHTKDIRSYKKLKKALNVSQEISSYLYRKILFGATALQIFQYSLSWDELTEDFSSKNWSDIQLLADLLTIANVNTDGAFKWLDTVIEQNEHNGALGMIGQRMFDWVLHTPGVENDLENKLPVIINDKRIARLLSPILRGIYQKQAKGISYYKDFLEPLIEPSNAYSVLYGLGFVYKTSQEDIAPFFLLAIEKLNSQQLSLPDFITLCSELKIYRQELLNLVEKNLPETKDPALLNSISNLLFFDSGRQLEKGWVKDTGLLLMTKDFEQITQGLNHLLIDIAGWDLEMAYELFELRMRIMAHMGFLEEGLVEMASNDVQLFQKKLIKWFTMDDRYIHTALRKICSVHELRKGMFNIPTQLFDGMSNRDKVFMAYKIAGYIYSMEEMQKLFLSLAKSITEESEAMHDVFYFILSDYIVYNYRGTMELMRADLELELSPFAKKLFSKVIKEYDDYFAKLKEIKLNKELVPYTEHQQYRSFYMRKQFSSIPSTVRKNSLASLFKNTQLNSNKWAIREPGHPKHVVQQLAHYSFSTEFPSGENLDPIYQEYTRRTYQKLRKDEIDID